MYAIERGREEWLGPHRRAIVKGGNGEHQFKYKSAAT
jgi:hypothetical protein